MNPVDEGVYPVDGLTAFPIENWYALSEVVYGVIYEEIRFGYRVVVVGEVVETPKNTVVPAMLHPGVAVRVNEVQPLGGFHDAEIDSDVREVQSSLPIGYVDSF